MPASDLWTMKRAVHMWFNDNQIPHIDQTTFAE
jgi:hypothetical protein